MKFGTDGIRGPAATILPAAATLGSAVVQVLGPRIVIGGDTRPSTPAIVAEVVRGVVESGGEAIDVGVIPTAGVSQAIVALGADGGVMVTASHNPAPDNGLKALGRDGRKLGGLTLAALEAAHPKAAPGGRATTQDFTDGYVASVLARLPPGRWLRGARITVDAAAGAGTIVAPRILRLLGADVVEIVSDEVNRFGATHPERIIAEVADAGIALDGDGDRGLLIGGDGTQYDGDALLWLLRRAPIVVGTIMSNAGLERALAGEGIRLHRSAVGDANVAADMDRLGAEVGGEPSGHTLLRDGLPTADGLLSCLRALYPGPESLAERAAGWIPDASVSRAVRDAAGTVDGCRETITRLEGEGARVVVRKSGTEPVIRVMVEHPERAVAEAGAAALVAILEGR